MSEIKGLKGISEFLGKAGTFLGQSFLMWGEHVSALPG